MLVSVQQNRKPSSRVTNPSASTFRRRLHRRCERGANFSFAHVPGGNVKVAAINARSSHFSRYHPAGSRSGHSRGSLLRELCNL